MNYINHLLIFFNMYCIVALSLNLLVGYCGLFTLAHAAYFAVGAYSYAVITMTLGLGFIPTAILVMIIGAVLSLAISLPAWRFRGDFFVLVTLAMQALIFSLIYNWSDMNSPLGTLWNMTNGPLGIVGISKPVIFGYELDTIGSIYVLSAVMLLISAFIFWLLKRSPWGRLLKSMRDDELAARGLGKSARLAKVYAIAISCSFSALAGTIYSSYVTFIDPSSALLDQSILMLCMLIVGGSGSFLGPLVGTSVLLAIPEILRLVHLPDALSSNIRLLAYGLLLIIMVHLRPQGLAGEYKIE